METRNGQSGLSSGNNPIRPTGLVPSATGSGLGGIGNSEAAHTLPSEARMSQSGDGGNAGSSGSESPVHAVSADTLMAHHDLAATADFTRYAAGGAGNDGHGNDQQNCGVAGRGSTSGANLDNTVELGPPNAAVSIPASWGQAGSPLLHSVDGSIATFARPLQNGVPADPVSDGNDAHGFTGIFVGVVVDIDLSIYSPVNIAIAGPDGTALAYQVNAPSFSESAPHGLGGAGSFGLFLQEGGLVGVNGAGLPGTQHGYLHQTNLNISDHDANAFSSANSGVNTLGGALAFNVANPAVSTATGINFAPVAQTNGAFGGRGVDDFGIGHSGQSNVNLSDHDAGALSGANSGANSIIGGLLAINAANPSISTAIGLNFSPVLQSDAADSYLDMVDPDLIDFA